jgi:energy-coupling factor transporter ATP-binding protein EcfA2
MLKNISIHNFKVFKKFENVGLNKVTLIGGKNDTGKTTFLESLFLYFDRKSPILFPRMLGWRGLAKLPIDPETIWAPYFTNRDMSNEILLIAKEEDRIGQLHIIYKENHVPKVPIPVNNNGVFIPSMSGGMGFRALSITHKTNDTIDYIAFPLLHNGLSYEIEMDVSNNLQSCFFMGYKMVLDEGNTERLGRLDKNDEQDTILEIMRQFEPKLQRFQVIREGLQDIIYADFGNKQKMPVNMLGDGFCRCLTLALVLTVNPPDILFIDEVGSGIHFSMLNTLWKFIINASGAAHCQVIATTHSYETIKSFCECCKKNRLSDSSYIRMEKWNEQIFAHQFIDDDLSFAIASELEVR